MPPSVFLGSEEPTYVFETLDQNLYATQSDISRARLWFYEGKRKIMLYTERSHFYHRYKIRGVQNLIIYSLLERKEFFPEIVNMLDGPDSMKRTVMFSCHGDKFRLERIVGTAGAKRMVDARKVVLFFTIRILLCSKAEKPYREAASSK